MELLPPPQSGLLLTPELIDAAARRSGHARALGVVVVVVVDLLRAVLADLHEEGVELRHDERDPDSEACVVGGGAKRDVTRSFKSEPVARRRRGGRGRPQRPRRSMCGLRGAAFGSSDSFAFGVTGRFLRPADSPSVNRGSTTRPQTGKLKAQLRTFVLFPRWQECACFALECLTRR